jgi:hypothetical protein
MVDTISVTQKSVKRKDIEKEMLTACMANEGGKQCSHKRRKTGKAKVQYLW